VSRGERGRRYRGAGSGRSLRGPTRRESLSGGRNQGTARRHRRLRMMGRAHAYAYRAAPLIRPSSITFTPVVMSGRNALAVAKVSADCGITSGSRIGMN